MHFSISTCRVIPFLPFSITQAHVDYAGKLTETVNHLTTSSSAQVETISQTVSNNSMATGELARVLERLESTLTTLGSVVIGVQQGQQRLESGTLQLADGLVASQQRLGDCTLQLAERVVSAQQRLETSTQQLGTGMLSAVAAFSDSTSKSAEAFQQFSATNHRAMTLLECNQVQMNSLVQQNQQTAHYLRGVSTILTGTPQLLDDISRPLPAALASKVTMTMPPPLSPAVLYQQQRQQHMLLQQQQQQMVAATSAATSANPGLPSPAMAVSTADITSFLTSRPDLGQQFMAFLAQKNNPSSGGDSNLPSK